MIECSPQLESADLLLTNGKVWTLNPKMRWAEAVAIKGDKIVFVGPSKEATKHHQGNNTKVIDLEEKLVLPGFNDSHVHFSNAGEFYAGVELQDVHTEEEFVQRVKDSVERLPGGEWITGGYWGAYEQWSDNHNDISDTFLPNKGMIDSFTSEHPILLYRFDKNTALANNKALKLAGINENSISPSGGEIVRFGKAGNPTGLLKGSAINLVEKMIPTPTFERKLLEAKIALKKLREYGITTIQDIILPEYLTIYQKLLESNELTVRVLARPPIENWRDYKNNGVLGNNSMLKLLGFKGYVDGMVGNCSALFFDSYVNNSKSCGINKFSQAMENSIWEMFEAGFTPHIHAIGDKGVRIALDLYERIIKEKNLCDHRFRIIHAQVVHPDDFKRFGELGIVAEVNPFHCIDDMRCQWSLKNVQVSVIEKCTIFWVSILAF